MNLPLYIALCVMIIHVIYYISYNISLQILIISTFFTKKLKNKPYVLLSFYKDL